MRVLAYALLLFAYVAFVCDTFVFDSRYSKALTAQLKHKEKKAVESVTGSLHH